MPGQVRLPASGCRAGREGSTPRGPDRSERQQGGEAGPGFPQRKSRQVLESRPVRLLMTPCRTRVHSAPGDLRLARWACGVLASVLCCSTM